MKKTLKVESFTTAPYSANYHAREFIHAGKIHCAAHVPTQYGFRWELERKNVPKNVDGGWEKLPATFRHNFRAQTIEVNF